MAKTPQTNRILLALLIHLPPAYSVSQTTYPADSILFSPEPSLLEKVTVIPISLWQRLSYKTSLLNCQFHPSCSNYAAGSISEHGVLVGSALAADRIIRCNPAALHYQVQQLRLSNSSSIGFHSDGRLKNPVPGRILEKSGPHRESPLLAAGISAMIPGAGRMYAGRFWDGLFGFFSVGVLVNVTHMSVNSGNRWGTALSATATLIFYSGEVIGAYRAAAETVP